MQCGDAVIGCGAVYCQWFVDWFANDCSHILRQQYVQRQLGNVDADGQSGEHDHIDCIEPESFELWPGGELYGQCDGVESYGHGAVQHRRERVWFPGDAEFRFGDIGQHFDADGGNAHGDGGVLGQHQ